MPSRIPRRGRGAGGIVGYPLDAVHEEVAFVAFHFHWAPEQIFNMEHQERRRWVAEISSINRELNQYEA